MHLKVTEPELSKSSSFSLWFQQCQDVSLTDRTFHITDDGSICIIKKLHSDLKGTTIEFHLPFTTFPREQVNTQQIQTQYAF